VANLPIERLTHHILYAQTHSLPSHAWRHRTTAKIMVQDTSSRPESSDEDDADVSPYK
jgi:hypothetical protein